MPRIPSRLFLYVYAAMFAVCIFSCALWACMHGYAPFGVRVSYTQDGGGTGLVISKTAFHVAEGSRGVFYNSDTEAVSVMQVVGSVRRGGELYYFDSRAVPQTVYPANALVGRVVGVVPFLGTWVQALAHPVGVMALIGSSLVMVLVDMLLLCKRRLFASTGRGGMVQRTIGGYISLGTDARV